MQAWLSRETVLGADERETFGPYDAWKRVGFMRYVSEYWRLAFALSRQHESALRLVQSGLPGVTLRKFDETDMTQVHDLIVELQDVNLGEYDM